MKGRTVLRLLPWLVLWAAFAAFGAWVCLRIRPWAAARGEILEIHGMDYLRYSDMLGSWQMVFYAAFRHPLYGWIMSPVIGLATRCRELGPGPFWGCLICFFSGVMTAAHYLVYRLLRRLALTGGEAAALTVLFASFAASGLLAACPESFNLSCLLALATLHFARRAKRPADEQDSRLELAGWGVLAVLTGGITCTQVVKTALAYSVARRPGWRRIGLLALGVLLAGVLVASVFFLRLYLRTPEGQLAQAVAGALANIGVYFNGEGASCLHRLGRIFVFFTEPVVTRGEPFAVNVLPCLYRSPLAACVALVPLAAAAVSAVVARRELLVRLIGAMFLVDVGIHFVLFWGMDEAQIYAGHWYYALPVLLGLGLVRLPGRLRPWASVAILALAGTIAALNASAWLS